MQSEIKSRKFNLEGDQTCLAPGTLILPILFPNQMLISVVLASLSKKSSSQSSSRERLFVDGTVSVPLD